MDEGRKGIGSSDFLYKSPSTYKFMREKLKIVLPAISTISDWIGVSKCLPGFNKYLFQQIKKKVSVMDRKEAHCSLTFDELKIKKCFEYSKQLDLIEVYVDHGNGYRKNIVGMQIIVFMVRGFIH